LIIEMNQRVFFYTLSCHGRPSLADDQLHQLQEVADREGWLVAEQQFTDPSAWMASRCRRHGFDELLRNIQPGDLVAVYSVGWLAKSLPDLIKLIAEIRKKGAALYFHEAAGTDAMETIEIFQRSLRREASTCGQIRARLGGVRFGRPCIAPAKLRRVQQLLSGGKGIRETARKVGGISPASVCEIAKQMRDAA
jgi:DNA invertase Pin-like site-specific DNA recombinase